MTPPRPTPTLHFSSINALCEAGARSCVLPARASEETGDPRDAAPLPPASERGVDRGGGETSPSAGSAAARPPVCTGSPRASGGESAVGPGGAVRPHPSCDRLTVGGQINEGGAEKKPSLFPSGGLWGRWQRASLGAPPGLSLFPAPPRFPASPLRGWASAMAGSRLLARRGPWKRRLASPLPSCCAEAWEGGPRPQEASLPLPRTLPPPGRAEGRASGPCCDTEVLSRQARDQGLFIATKYAVRLLPVPRAPDSPPPAEGPAASCCLPLSCPRRGQPRAGHSWMFCPIQPLTAATRV